MEPTSKPPLKWVPRLYCAAMISLRIPRLSKVAAAGESEPFWPVHSRLEKRHHHRKRDTLQQLRYLDPSPPFYLEKEQSFLL